MDQVCPAGIPVEFIFNPWCAQVTLSELVSVLCGAGWSAGRDEVGDIQCIFRLPDRQVQVIPSVSRRAEHFRIAFMPSVSTREFSDVVGAIVGSREGHAPIICMAEVPQKIESPKATDILSASEKILALARSEGIGRGLEAYRRLPVSAKGALPLRHLAALALGRGVGTLDSYRVAFEQGERPGFVPYITLEMIERALRIARGE